MIFKTFLFFSLFLNTFTFSSGGDGSGLYKIYYPIVIFFTLVTLCLSKGLKFFKEIYLFFLFFLIYILVSFFNDLSFDFYIVAVVIAICGLSLSLSMLNDPLSSVLVIKAFILFNTAFLIYQFLYTVIFGEGIYLHGLLFSFSREAYSLVEMGAFYRMSGYHLEPGSYATIIALMLFLYRYLNNGKVELSIHFCSLSLLLTFSVIGFLLFAIFYLSYFKSSFSFKKSFFLLIILAFVCSVFIYELGIFSYIEQRFAFGASDDSSASVKIANLYYFIHNYDLEKFLIGYGMQPDLNLCSTCGHVQSNGVLFNLFFLTGFILTLFFFALLYYSGSFKAFLPLIIGFSIVRYGPSFIIFWLVFSFMINARSYKYAIQ
ncbi:MAG: hypothetical protein GYB35_14745 [Algicola sp.]|nr:hypothetical protein [Algicola sp.]